MERMAKVWGQRFRLFENDLNEVCYLDLVPNARCSYHFHNSKSNFFFVVSGKLVVKTERGTVELGPNEFFTVHPQDKHEFQTKELPTKVIEIAYIKLDPEDIYRDATKLGGPLNE